jgi:RNA polymerase sigma factor (sigma-70 family)
MADGHRVAGLGDAQLLERFVRQQDEAAFAAMLERHGPMVFGVCKRLLRDLHEAEDAFQATFLVLVRKAGSIGRGESLGCWLYEVACRTALRARSNASKRRTRERQVGAMADTSDTHTTGREIHPLLDEEMRRLPEQYRRPLVLCYLEGKTHAEAAVQLGWPKGTVAGRLSRARDMLRQRLAQRGVTLTATALLAVFADNAPAAVPGGLLNSTLRAGLLFAAGRAPVGPASPEAVNLANEVLHVMLTHKLKMAIVFFAAFGLLAGGLAQNLGPAALAQQAPPAAAAPGKGERADDPLPAGATSRMGGTQFRHGDRIYFVAYTPDGKQLVTGSDDNTLRLWDAGSGREIHHFATARAGKSDPPVAMPLGMVPGQSMPHRSMAVLSHDGKVLAAISGNDVTWWDVPTGKQLHHKRGPSPVLSALAFVDGGKSLLVTDVSGRPLVWDVATGKSSQPEKPGRQDSVPIFGPGDNAALSPDGKVMARFHFDQANNAFSIKLRDLASDKDLSEIDTGSPPLSLRFSPDGKVLAWVVLQGEVNFWDLAAGKNLDPLGNPDQVRIATLVFAPDGKMLALGRDDGSVEVWDVPARKLSRRILEACLPIGPTRFFALGSTTTRTDLGFSPDGKTLAVGASRSSLRQFDVATGKEVGPEVVGHRSAVRSLGVSADGKTMITHARGDSVRFWDAASGKERRHVPAAGATLSAALSADGTLLAAADKMGRVVLYETATGKAERTMKGRPVGPVISALAFSADGKVLAARESMTRAVQLWDVATGKERPPLSDPGNSGPVYSPLPITGRRVITPEMAFSPGGQFVAAAAAKDQLALWDAATGAKLREFALADLQAVMRFEFSPDGRTLAAAGADGQVTLYETATGIKRGQLGKSGRPAGPGNDMAMPVPVGVNIPMQTQDYPFSLAFSPDGRILAAAGPGPEIRLWGTLTGAELGTSQGHQGGVLSLAFSPDGKRLHSGSLDGTALAWDVAALAGKARPSEKQLGADEGRKLWDALADADGVSAFQAVGNLVASPAESVALLKQQLKPAAAVDPERLARLVADLDAKSFSAREKAMRELEQLGDLAVPALRAAEKGAALEIRQRAEQLLRKLTLQSPAGDAVRGLRAVEVLEQVGTPEARQVLRTIAGGAEGSRLTVAAREALTRLSRK